MFIYFYIDQHYIARIFLITFPVHDTDIQVHKVPFVPDNDDPDDDPEEENSYLWRRIHEDDEKDKKKTNYMTCCIIC